MHMLLACLLAISCLARMADANWYPLTGNSISCFFFMSLFLESCSNQDNWALTLDDRLHKSNAVKAGAPSLSFLFACPSYDPSPPRSDLLC